MSDPVIFSRPVNVNEVPGQGSHFAISANEDERARLAAFLDLPEIQRLEAKFHVKPWGRTGLSVRGEIDAEIVQICGVTLEPFPARVQDEVDANFTDPADLPPVEQQAGAEYEANLDAPDLLVNGGVDLGALASEHLALAMDPYPIRPEATSRQVEAAPEDRDDSTHRPFAALDRLMLGRKDKGE
ncbi:YceD family protein [Terrihabitans sp. B22-R8]|uniref:YceD family protein n=1 Tax=Terrihabitans sp. B22-R8 TaxID=3425128 RepID=UPI00403CF3CD